MYGVTAIEFESVNTIDGDKLIQLPLEPSLARRIRQVQDRTETIPPKHNGGPRRVVSIKNPDRLALFNMIEIKVFIEGTIRRNIGTHPEHHLESIVMQCVDHGFRIVEPGFGKSPVAIVIRPSFIDHESSRRKTVIDDLFRVLQNILLILIVSQFNPRIELGTCKENGIRNFALRRKKGLADVLIDFF